MFCQFQLGNACWCRVHVACHKDGLIDVLQGFFYQWYGKELVFWSEGLVCGTKYIIFKFCNNEGTFFFPSGHWNDFVFYGYHSLSDKWQFRHTVTLGDVGQHSGEPLRITNLILHVIVSLKHGIMAAGVGFHHCLTVFEMLLFAAELEIDKAAWSESPFRPALPAVCRRNAPEYRTAPFPDNRRFPPCSLPTPNGTPLFRSGWSR